MTPAIQISDRLARIASPVRSVFRRGLDVLYPPLCLICRTPVGEAHGLCGACWGQITFIDGPVCDCCGLPFELNPGVEFRCASCLANPPPFDCARAAMHYDDGSRPAILALKRADRLEFSNLFALWLKRAGQRLLDDADLIVPVPLHPIRLWLRRYNQSALLAQRLHRLTGKPFDPLSLLRVRATPSQGKMPSAKARRRNVQGAFKVPSRKVPAIAGRKVLLIDDVLTTGATIGACARALRRAGATKVFVLTIARVARPLPAAV